MNVSDENLRYIDSIGTPLEGYFAMKAIQWIAKTGQPMPEELITWLDVACDAYIEKQGQRIKSRLTSRENYQIVSDVHMLRKHGYTRDYAIAEIAKREDLAVSTVKRYYKAGDNEAKVSCDKLFRVMGMLDENDHDDAEALREFSPIAIVTRKGVKRK